MRAPESAVQDHSAPLSASPTGSLTLRLSDPPRAEDDIQSAHLRLDDADRLRRAESWDEAIAAYRAAIGAAAPTDRDLLSDANRHLGFCLRMAGRLGPAADAYAEAVSLAHALRDVRRALLARIGSAVVVFYRGNLPAAADMLEAVVLEAESLMATNPALVDVVARAKHDRATIAHDRGRPEVAVADLYEAFHLYTDPAQRDRVLIDMARAFGDLGLTDVARDALSLCERCAAGTAARMAAMINLLDIAQRDGDRVSFDHYREALASESLIPRHLAYYHLFVGEGLRRFGDAGATDAYERARAIAEEHGLNEIVLRTDAALSSSTPSIVARGARAAPVTPAVQRVAASIHALAAYSAG
jgi:tetratricopeptide (TPR) repeat protein